MAFPSEIEKLRRRWAENPLGLTFASYAEACRKAGDLVTALQVLSEGLAQHPDYVPAHIVQGRCHLDAHADTDAEAVFVRVLELDPENVIALRSLAELSERAGRLPEAIGRLKQLLELDRNNEEARGQLDRVLELQSAPPPPERMEDIPEGLIPNLVEPEAGAAESAGPSPSEPLVLEESYGLMPLESGDLETFPDSPLVELGPMQGEAPSLQSHGDFELSNDSEAIRPSQQGMDDIVRGAEPPDFDFHVPSAEVERVAEPAAMEALDALEPVAPPEPPPAMLEVEMPEPEVDILPPPPPLTEEETVLPPPPLPPRPELPTAEPAPVMVESVEPEPAPTYFEAEPHHAPSAAPEPELVVTESMAEVFLRQGYRELARAVYSQLAERDPSDARIAAALAQLQDELAPPPASPSPAPQEPVRRFDAAATGGRSVGSLFSGLLRATRPAVSATVHPPAFEAPRRPAGEPTRPAQESLSLSAVFGEEASPPDSAGGAAPKEVGEPSFDEFYAPETTASGGNDVAVPPAVEASTDPAAPASAAAPSQSDEDLQQFNAWLRGLKR
jgi:tetratricopeptide (TPR) repeat protein